jgi:predicted metal-binding membrane protein
MNAAAMSSATATGMGMGLVSVPMMAAMMLPSAAPAIARRAKERDGALGAPMFAGSYLVIWGIAGLAAMLAYRPPSATIAGALIVAAGLYELTPLKRGCRRRCRERVRSGMRFGVYCLGSSVRLMVVLLALNPMSVPLMCGIAAIVLAQKLLPANPAADIPIALLIVGVGIAVAAA